MSTLRSVRAIIIGAAGDGLTSDSTWASSSQAVAAGNKGEAKTGAILDDFARRHPGVAVLHNLRFPSPHFKANIDHLVVTGKRVFVIDSKLWKPGFYWTYRGKTYRGFTRFAHADKKFFRHARRDIGRFLSDNGFNQARIQEPATWVVWPSSSRARLSLVFARVAAVRLVPGDKYTPAYVRRTFGTKPANPQLVAVLSKLREVDQPSAAGF